MLPLLMLGAGRVSGGWMLVRLLERLDPLRQLPIWASYGFTALIVLAFAGLRSGISSLDASVNLPLFLVFVPAVILSAMLFDKGSGFFAVILSGSVGLVFFVEPVGVFASKSVGEIIRLIFFLLIGAFTAALIETFRHTIDDLNATKRRLEEANRHRDLLLADINHRIKNHLGSLSAVLSLSKRRLSDDAAKEALDAAVSRLAVLGRVYTRLHIADETVTLDAKEFLDGLCDDLSHSLLASRHIELRTDFEPMQMDAQTAISLGLILNELVANAIKYAFPDERSGTVTARLECRTDKCCFEVADDGIGLAQARSAPGTGTRLIRSLAAELGGTVTWDASAGMRVSLSMPRVAAQVSPATSSTAGAPSLIDKRERSFWKRISRREDLSTKH